MGLKDTKMEPSYKHDMHVLHLCAPCGVFGHMNNTCVDLPRIKRPSSARFTVKCNKYGYIKASEGSTINLSMFYSPVA